MSGFSRTKPDELFFRRWLSGEVDQVPGWYSHARNLWTAFVRAADQAGFDAGSPRSFANELRKAGHPWRRADDLPNVGLTARRTRYHCGLRLKGDEKVWFADYGFEDRPLLLDRAERIRAAECELERFRRESWLRLVATSGPVRSARGSQL